MKKIFFAALAVLMISSAAMAQYTGPKDSVATVAEALKMPDDAYVTLTGRIDRHLGGKKYQFSDATGVITVEIKSRHWAGGLTVSPEDTVTVFGKIDKDFGRREVEVKQITKH